MVKGLETFKGEGTLFKVLRSQMKETARLAREGEFDYGATTLSISPMKNTDKLNEISICWEEKYGVEYLQSDFKRKADTNVQLNFQKNMIFIGRIITAAYIPCRRER